jgi:tRNA 5-methylaminomethyl-2-thiouridine biosynthesis bifunctional protein
MAEPVEWASDGTPRSARFDDIYRSATGGLEQARHVFLQGCGLPAAWAGLPHWRVLEAGFGLGLNFLATWRCWKDDPQRPRMLHYVSIEAWPVAAADLVRSAQAHPELQPLADELALQWWGLTPGFHRLAFEGGQVLLTVCIGDVQAMLRELDFRADSVYLDGFEPQRNPEMWSLGTLKAVARLCRRGAGLATWTSAGQVRRDLLQCGFQVGRTEGLPPKRHSLRGTFDPAWAPKGLDDSDATFAERRCVVVGAGLAGAAVAASLARRGWQVEVLDRASQPAAGASALPAGLMAPHQSPDDNPLSRLTRTGIRMTLQQAEHLLVAGDEWQLTGALEHRLDDTRAAPDLGDMGSPWTRDADDVHKSQALLAPADTAWWHERAAWIKPAALVRAWLAGPGIAWRGNTRVHRLHHANGQWQALDASDRVLAQAPMVVLAAAYGSAPLLSGRVELHPVRGQASWAPRRPGDDPWPAAPLNGHGHLLPAVPLDQGLAWLTGSTYGRDDADAAPREDDQRANLERLGRLLPDLAARLAPAFAAGEVRSWTGTRCASADRRPLVGEVEAGLWLSTAMGSRGLSFAALCAELLAAQLHGEPLPLPRKLAEALSVRRQLRAR